MIAGVWILSMVVSLPPLAGWKRAQPVVDGFAQCVLSEEPGYVIDVQTGYVIYSTVASFYVPLVVIVLVYSRVFVAARTRARRNLTPTSQGQRSRGQRSQGQRSRRGGRRMTQSVTQLTMAGNVNKHPPSDQSSSVHVVQLGPRLTSPTRSTWSNSVHF